VVHLASVRNQLEHRRKRVLPEGSLRARLARGSVWSITAGVLSQSFTVAGSIVAARMLGQVQFGEFAIVNGTVGMLGVFAGVGLGRTATKYVAELRAQAPERAGRILGLAQCLTFLSAGLAALVLFLLAPLLAARTLNAPGLAGELRLGCGLLFFNGLNGVQTGALYGFEAFQTVARLNLLRGLLNFAALVLGAWLGGLSGAVGGMVLATMVVCGVNNLALRAECRRAKVRLQYRDLWCERGVIWSFALPTLLASSLTGPAIWAANTMLVNQPGGYAEMGVFNAVEQWRLAIIFLPAMMSTVTLPILANLHGQRDQGRHMRLVWSSLLVTSAVALCVAAPIMLVSDRIMRLYGTEFGHGDTVLVLMAVAAILFAANGVVGNAILSVGATWRGFVFNLLWAACFLIAARLLVPHGAKGLAVAYVISYLLHTVWQIAYLVQTSRGARRGVVAESGV